MAKNKKGRFVVDVLFTEEWSLCKFLRVINPRGMRFDIPPDTTIKLEDYISKNEINKSETFLKFMAENFSFTNENKLIVIPNDDDCLS